MSEPTRGLLEAIQRHIEEEERRLGIVRVEVPVPLDFVPCSWCGGNRCAACFAARERREKELAEEYARQFPNGPQPLFSVPTPATPEEWASLRRVIGIEALEKAFGPGGGGVEEIEANAVRERERERQEKGGQM